MNTLKLSIALIAVLQLAACSKTVQWEEEVPLNTGETIWVKRTDTFRRVSEPGNPLKSSWWPEIRSYEFVWQGQKYSYHTESMGALLLYGSVNDRTVSIFDSTSRCGKPGFGEFKWKDGKWQLQKSVSQEFVGLPRNLMAYYSSDDGAIPAQVTKDIRTAEDTNARHGDNTLKLEPSKIAIDCSGCWRATKFPQYS